MKMTLFSIPRVQTRGFIALGLLVSSSSMQVRSQTPVISVQPVVQEGGWRASPIPLTNPVKTPSETLRASLDSIPRSWTPPESPPPFPLQPQDDAPQLAAAPMAAGTTVVEDALVSAASIAKIDEATPEITELAKALGNNLVSIFKFVRDQIKTEDFPIAQKGAHVTLLCGSGGAYDKCALLASLLKAAGYLPDLVTQQKSRLFLLDG
jgi:hypothetical protein